MLTRNQLIDDCVRDLDRNGKQTAKIPKNDDR